MGQGASRRDGRQNEAARGGSHGGILTGCDVLRAESFERLRGSKVGLIANATCTPPTALPPLKLASRAPSLASGAPSLASGAPSLASGAPSLASGAPSLASGAPSLASGAPSLASRAPSLASGAPSLASRAPSLASGAPSHRQMPFMADAIHGFTAVHSQAPFHLVAIFGPEHGFRGTAQRHSAGEALAAATLVESTCALSFLLHHPHPQPPFHLVAMFGPSTDSEAQRRGTAQVRHLQGRWCVCVWARAVVPCTSLEGCSAAASQPQPPFHLLPMFGPEHGSRCTVQAGKSESASKDPKTGLPIFDLYGKVRRRGGRIACEEQGRQGGGKEKGDGGWGLGGEAQGRQSRGYWQVGLKGGGQVRLRRGAGGEQVRERRGAGGEQVRERRGAGGEQVRERRGAGGEQVRERRGAGGEQVRERRGASGEQVRERRGAGGEQVRERRGAGGEQVRERRGAGGEQVRERRGAGGEQVRERRGAGGEQVRERRGAGGEQVRERRGAGGEQVRERRGAGGEQVRERRGAGGEQVRERRGAGGEQVRERRGAGGEQDSQSIAKCFEASGADTIVFDIQDVGARFYTFIWTLYDCLVAAALCPSIRRFLVLDRPNPLGGVVVDGPITEPQHASFVGRKCENSAHTRGAPFPFFPATFPLFPTLPGFFLLTSRHLPSSPCNTHLPPPSIFSMQHSPPATFHLLHATLTSRHLPSSPCNTHLPPPSIFSMQHSPPATFHLLHATLTSRHLPSSPCNTHLPPPSIFSMQHSPVGPWAIPLRHGMTVDELALLFFSEFLPP
ncbi:unnamed protein product [Closterium sp. NIES-65]|nr:unnamed protein product [Closterium sp. NIES-65]